MIKELLQELLRNNEEMYSKVCVVDAVNGLTCDATPVDGSAKILDIRLTANASSQNYYATVPKAGSQILVTFLNKDVAFASLVDDPDKLIYVSGPLVFEVTDKFLVKVGNDNLAKIMTDLIDASKTEIHKTNSGVTLGLNIISTQAYDAIKNRITNLLKDA